MTDARPLLELRQLTAQVGESVVLDAVSTTIGRGEIVGLMGASGAGKSALLRTLAGLAPVPGVPFSNHATAARASASRASAAASATMLWCGRELDGHDSRQATALGIVLVPQHPRYPEEFSVADALTLGIEPARFGRLDRAARDRMAAEWADRIGLRVAVATQLDTLSPIQRQLVALARALAGEPVLLLLDAPTAALRPQDTDAFFEILGDLQARGTAVVFASDRVGEVAALASRVLVLRDGRLAGELARAELNPKSLGALLVGTHLDLPLKELIEPGLERLRVDGLRTQAHPGCAVSFSVREGEIIGLAGLLGSGRRALIRAVVGLDIAAAGSVHVNGTELPNPRLHHALAAGMVFVPDDAAATLPPADLPLADALTLARLPRLSPAGVVNRSALGRLAALLNEHLAITEVSVDTPLARLNRSQRRKAMLARALSGQPSVVILDSPTRGVTLQARAEIYEALERLAERGAAVLFVSDDTDELLRISDRLIVMREGAVAGELGREDDFSERGIVRLAAGLPT